MNELLIDRLRETARERCPGTDPAHDYLHVLRVAKNAQRIALGEKGDLAVVVPAALLHELFSYPKNHPESSRSGEVCAQHAREVLVACDYPAALIDPICYCIEVHPFSMGVDPDTLEARILQDADRLDSIGAIGVARCFSTGAVMKTPFYQADDPFCDEHEPNDKQWSVDHFYKKLLKIQDRLHTGTAREIAAVRTEYLQGFLDQLREELDQPQREG